MGADDERRLLDAFARSATKRKKVLRAMERRWPALKTRKRVEPVNVAAARASLRKAAVDVEVEKRTAARGERLLRIADVMKATGLGRTTLWQLERHGDFPPRQKLTGAGGRAVGWRASDVARWCATRKAARKE